MKKAISLICMSAMIFCAWAKLSMPAPQAMPSTQELKAAKSIVTENMAPFVAKFNAKKISAMDVAEKALLLGGEAKTPAEKYLYYMENLHYEVLGNDFKKAGSMLGIIIYLFPDIPSETLLEITSNATKHATSRSAPELFAYHRFAQVKEGLKSRPDDTQLIRSLAELNFLLNPKSMLGLAGSRGTNSWKDACKLFAKCGGELGKIAQQELDGKFSPIVHADFWWNYSPQEKLVNRDGQDAVSDVIRYYVAYYYVKAIRDKEVDGTKKDLAEQRVLKMRPEDGRLLVAEANGRMDEVQEIKAMQQDLFKAMFEAREWNAKTDDPFKFMIGELKFDKPQTLYDAIEFLKRVAFKGKVEVTFADKDLLKRRVPQMSARRILAQEALILVCKSADCKVTIDPDAKTAIISKNPGTSESAMNSVSVADKVRECPRTNFNKRMLPKNRNLNKVPSDMLCGEKWMNGTTVFGRLEIEGATVAKKVGTWMPILYLQDEAQSGYPVGNYFLGVMHSDRKYVSFVKFGYETVKMSVPEAERPFKGEEICNLGVLEMRKLRPEEAGSIEFKVSLPKETDKATCNIALLNDCPLTPRDNCLLGVGMIIPWSDCLSKEVHAGEKVRLDGCTPGLYSIQIFQRGQPGEVAARTELYRFVEVAAGKPLDLGTMELLPKRQGSVSVRPVADKGAKWDKHKPMEGMFDKRSLVEVATADGGNDIFFQVLGYRKDGSAVISIPTTNLQIADLGKLSGKKFNQLEAKRKLPSSVPVKIREFIKGHPDLLSQSGKCVLQKGHIYRFKQLDVGTEYFVAFDVPDL